MSAGRGDTTPAATADAVLGTPGHRNRVRRLRRRRALFSKALALEFGTRAHDALREDPAEGLSRANLALEVAREIRAADAIAASLRARAQAWIQKGRFVDALRDLDEGRELSADDPTFSAELDALRLQPLVHLGRPDDARATAQRTLEVFEEAGSRPWAVRVRMTLADLDFREDRFRDALTQYRAVDRLLGPSMSPTVRAALAANRANALEGLNRFRAASRHFAAARALFEQQGCTHTVAQVDYNAAYAEMLRGRFEDALRRLSGAESMFEQTGDARHLAHVALDRAEIHVHLNLWEDALRLAADAETRFRGLGLVKEQAQAALLGGRAAELGGRLAEADERYLRAEDSFRDLGLDERGFQCRVQRACVAERGGRLVDAARLVAAADRLASEGMNPLSVAPAELLRARLDLANHRADEALARTTAVLHVCRRIHAPWVRIESRRIECAAHRACGRPERALAAAVDAIDELERYRGGVPPDEFMAAFLAARTEIYEAAVELLVELGDTGTAFRYVERAKSRALADLLAGRDLPPAAGREDAATARIRYLRERLAAVYGRIFHHPEGEGGTAARATAVSRRRAADLECEVARLLRDRRLAQHPGGVLEAPDAPDLESVRRGLEPGTTLLECFLTSRSLFLFVVTSKDVHVVRQEVAEEEIGFLLERFRFHLDKQTRPSVASPALVLGATRANLAKLTAVLLDPILEHIVGERLLVIPHGVLHQVPFHALPLDTGWVCDRFEVLYAPSAAVYAHCSGRTPSATGAPCVLGLPDERAPRIEDEARQVAKALGSDRLFLHEEATLARLREGARDARVLHVATHGMFRHAHPMLSAIRLADGWVNLYDLYGLEVRGELVVLSTCESGNAGFTRGDEVLGLTRGFLYAGAPALLTTQWRVDDDATAEFMRSFYAYLDSTGDAAVAHRHAMLDVRAAHPLPFFWAPFFLTGCPVRRPSRAQGQDPAHSERQTLSASAN